MRSNWWTSPSASTPRVLDRRRKAYVIYQQTIQGAGCGGRTAIEGALKRRRCVKSKSGPLLHGAPHHAGMEQPPSLLARDATHIIAPEEHLGWNDGRWGLLVSLCPQEVTDVVLSKDEIVMGRDPTSAVFVTDSRYTDHALPLRAQAPDLAAAGSARATVASSARIEWPICAIIGAPVALAALTSIARMERCLMACESNATCPLPCRCAANLDDAPLTSITARRRAHTSET